MQFQSTLPRGERQRNQRVKGEYVIFQSTLPRGERHICFRDHVWVNDFNPRSHGGSDGISGHFIQRAKNFNPRSHGGSDLTDNGRLKGIYIFQSTLPRGERQIISYFHNLFYNFNPRSHGGSDGYKFVMVFDCIPISIHAPTGGAT